MNASNENFYELGSDRYNTYNIYLNHKHIKAHNLIEKYKKMYPNYYYEVSEDNERVIAYPLFFLKEK